MYGPTLRPLFVTAALAASLFAQDPGQTRAASFATNRFVPADSMFVARIASPASWQARFAKTQIAKLLQSPSMAPLVQQVQASFDEMLREAREEGGVDVDMVERFMSDYRGDIVVSMQLDPAALAASMQEDQPPPVSFVIAMTPADGFDLPAMAAMMQETAERENGSELRDLVVGDLRLRYAEGDGETPAAAMPVMIDGHLVMIASDDLERDAARLLANDRRWSGDMSSGSMFVHMNVQPLMTALADTMSENGGMMLPFDMGQLMRTMGLLSVRDITFDLDADGEHVLATLGVDVAETDRGMFAMFPQVAQKPRLLQLVPPSAMVFSASKLDMKPVLGIVRELWRSMEDFVPMTWDDAMAAFTEATKVRLEEDLLAHLGDEMLQVQNEIDPASLDDEDAGPAAMVAGTVMGLALRDGRAFGESLERALRSRGLHAGRKTEDYAGVQVHRLRLAALFEIEYVVTEDLLLLGFGGDESTKRTLRDVLDVRKAGDGELPAAVQKQVAALPAGWSGLGATAFDVVLRSVSEAVRMQAEAEGGLPPEVEMVFETFGKVADDLRRLGIHQMVSATYTNRGGIVTRIRW